MNRDRTVAVRMTEEQHRTLEERAEEMGMTVSQYCRWKLELARNSRMRYKMLPVLTNDSLTGESP